MKTKISTRLQLLLGLLLLLLLILFPPQGFGPFFILPVLGLLAMRVLTNLLAKNRQLSYNWLSVRLGRSARPARPASVSRPVPRHAISHFREWIETNVSLVLIAWVPITLLLYLALGNLAQLFYAGLDKVYLLSVGSIYWGVLAMIAGASLAVAASQVAMQLLLREAYVDYIQQVERRFGFDLTRAVAWLVAGGLTGAALLTGPGLVTYTRFSVDGIAMHSPFGLTEKVQPYTEVQRIQFVTVPGQSRRGAPTAYFEIAFADGARWTTPRFDSRAVPPLYWDAVNYAAQQSQHAIERAAISEAFTTGARSWPVGVIDNDVAFATRSISNGKYQWQVVSRGEATYWQAARMPPVSDFQLNLDCQRLDGPETALCGTVFRRDAGDYYMFLIGEDQTIRFYLHYHGWIPLIEARASSAVRPNENNHITVNAIGSHFTFSVNGQVVAEAYDSTLRSGTVGVALQLPANHEATVQFSNLEVLEK